MQSEYTTPMDTAIQAALATLARAERQGFTGPKYCGMTSEAWFRLRPVVGAALDHLLHDGHEAGKWLEARA